MMIDGSGDQFIKLQGIDSYSLTDADGGEPGAESDDGEDVQLEESDAPSVAFVWQ